MDAREQLMTSLITEGYLKTPRIIEAFRAIDRKDFILPEYTGEAYGNYPLPIGHGQTISQPLTVAFLLELLEPKPGETIVDVGSGSGWTTALLAHVVSQKSGDNSGKIKDKKAGTVIAVERIPELCRFGEANVGKYNFVEKGVVQFICGDATKTIKNEAPFDKILVSAAAPDEIPEAWRRQLKVGGRIVAPIGQSIVVLDKISEKKYETKEHFGFSFVPLVVEREA